MDRARNAGRADACPRFLRRGSRGAGTVGDRLPVASSFIAPNSCSARRARAPETPPIFRYPSSVSTPSVRRSASSVRAYCRSGSVPGRSTTSATIAARSLGSTVRPARSAGATIARSSSSGDIGVIASVRAARRSPKPRTERGASKKSARSVATIADPARRLQRGGPDGLEQACPLVLIGEREDLLELVEDDQELGVGIGQHAFGRPDADPVHRAADPRAATGEVRRRHRAERSRARGTDGYRGARR